MDGPGHKAEKDEERGLDLIRPLTIFNNGSMVQYAWRVLTLSLFPNGTRKAHTLWNQGRNVPDNFFRQ